MFIRRSVDAMTNLIMDSLCLICDVFDCKIRENLSENYSYIVVWLLIIYPNKNIIVQILKPMTVTIDSIVFNYPALARYMN